MLSCLTNRLQSRGKWDQLLQTPALSAMMDNLFMVFTLICEILFRYNIIHILFLSWTILRLSASFALKLLLQTQTLLLQTSGGLCFNLAKEYLNVLHLFVLCDIFLL